MGGSLTWGRVLSAVVGVYHVVVGILLIASGDLSLRAAKAVAGWSIEGSPAMGIVGEILGCYLVAFGVMMLLAARDPIGGKHLLTVGLLLIALRVGQRLVFSEKVREVFQVPAAQHWGALLLVAAIGVALLVFRLQVERASASA